MLYNVLVLEKKRGNKKNMKSYSSREIKAILESNGWYIVNVEGDHWQFKHSIIKGRITLTHPVKDVSITVLKDIAKKSGLRF